MKTLRLRIRNQNKYYHNRGRADGLSGWPQNYEVNFRGCGTPYQTQGKTLIQMFCNLTNCSPSGDAYNNNQEFQEVSEIVLTTQLDWPLSDCWEHKRSKVQGRRPRRSDPVEVGHIAREGTLGAGQNDRFDVRIQELVSKIQNPGGFLRKKRC